MSVDITFRAIATVTMGEYWPVFAAGAAIEIWLVRRIRRSGQFRVPWIASISIATLALVAALWAQSFLVVQIFYQTIGEGAKRDVWAELGTHAERTLPLLAPLGLMLLAVVAHPRSHAVMGGLVAAAGVLVSWIAAMWLFTTNHQPAVLRVLVLPGGLGVVASLVGFGSVTALWMAISRWWWKEGRRRRSRGITSHADGDLPQLRP